MHVIWHPWHEEPPNQVHAERYWVCLVTPGPPVDIGWWWPRSGHYRGWWEDDRSVDITDRVQGWAVIEYPEPIAGAV